jgi:methylphosphotriester-DNA--protein-cysteine methyltransferase
MARKHLTNKDIYAIALLLKKAIDLNPLSRATIQELLPGIEIRRNRLPAVFKEITGIKFKDYQKKKRIEAACKMLRSGMSVKAVTIECGYGSYITNFSRDFKQVLNQTPEQWIKNNGANNGYGHHKSI